MAGALLAGCGGSSDGDAAEVRYTRNKAEVYDGLEHDSPVLSVLGFDTEVTVLGTHRSFVQVRTEAGLEGWVADALLLDRRLRSELAMLTLEAASLPGQGSARARDTLNVHTEPYRWAPTFYQLIKDERFEVLDRMLVDRLPAAAADGTGRHAPTGEDYWYLVRIPGRDAVGWLLANMVYPDIRADLLALAGGQPIVAHFRIGGPGAGPANETPEVRIWLQSGSRGQIHDFDRLRILRWDSRRERWIVIRQTSGLNGYLPVEILPGFQTDRGVGTRIGFVLEVDGTMRRRTYAQVGSRSVYLGEEPITASQALLPPGGFGKRYERRADPEN